MRLQGKAAVVTGGGAGLGEAMCDAFAAEGAQVLVADRDREGAERVAAAIRERGGDAGACPVDVADATQVAAMVEAAVDAFGKLDVIVNNAGLGGTPTPVPDVPLDEWDTLLAVNLSGVFYGCKYAWPHLERTRGAIVNISSMAGRRGLPYRVGYCSAKAGQIGMTYGLALELGRHNITVNAIAPGAVAGDRIDRMIKGQADVRGVDVDRMRQAYLDRSPLRRMSTAEDISFLAAFLCSEHARSISGQCIPVTAGEPA
jgi:NAD(P)-dependent dehydrogenase (short-subunit alcohol dehydrogenase family)